MGVYIFSPAGPNALQNTTLIKCVEYIGKLQAGRGSNRAKGIRYLKDELNCSGTAIKRTIMKKIKIIGNDEFEKYGLAVYYFHSKFSALIVEKIIGFVYANGNEEIKKLLFGYIPEGKEYLDLLYDDRLSHLHWVITENYCDQGEEATKINGDFEKLRKKLQM